MDMKALYWTADDQGTNIKETEIPADLKDTAEIWRSEMVEKIAELDDSLMEKFLTDPATITVPELKASLRKSVCALKVFPVLCGSALKYVGIQRVLDSVVQYLPNPTECPDVEGVDPRDHSVKMSRPHTETAPFSALVFKVVADVAGTLTYIRVYSATGLLIQPN